MRFDDPYLLAAAVVLLLAGFLIWLLVRRAGEDHAEGGESLQNLSVSARCVLSPDEISFYNLIRLAVGDRYLVFPQLPLWSLVTVQSTGGATQARPARPLAMRRVDLALIHPGTRTAHAVVLFTHADEFSDLRRRNEELAVSMLNAAGIMLVRMDPSQPHSIGSLKTAFGIEADEDNVSNH